MKNSNKIIGAISFVSPFAIFFYIMGMSPSPEACSVETASGLWDFVASMAFVYCLGFTGLIGYWLLTDPE